MFVVDASIFPGMPSTNPSGLIVVASERAAELIKALPAVKAVGRNGQCGGTKYTGAMVCAKPYTCKVVNKDMSRVCCHPQF